jgi:DNA-binding IclR family transcriptional regulator
MFIRIEQAKVLDLLAEEPEGLTTLELCDLTERSNSNMRRGLYTLEKDDLVAFTEGIGRQTRLLLTWRITSKGHAVLAEHKERNATRSFEHDPNLPVPTALTGVSSVFNWRP